MSAKTISVGVLALVFGLACAIGVKAFLDSQTGRSEKIVEQPKTIPVIVAKKMIPRGRIITADDVQSQEWPESLVSPEYTSVLEDVVDHAAVATIYEGDPIHKGRLATGRTHDLASHLAPGMRAFTVHIPTVGSGVAGFILPGNKVDVLLTVSDLPNLRESGAMTVTILQGVEILAVDQQTEAPASSKMDVTQMNSVTLSVTALQAAKLALAGTKGTLNLALRNPEDTQEPPTSPITLADLQFLKDQTTTAEKPVVSLATHLATGMRAFTIKATLTSGVAGLVLPKDRVDVLLTTKKHYTASEEGEAATVSLLQDIEVLAIDQLLDAPAANKTEPKQQYVVTLAVSPIQAATLALAETEGTLSLLLRSPHDVDSEDAATRVTSADLRLPQRTHSTAVAKSLPLQQLHIRTLRGSQNGMITVYPLNDTERKIGATGP